MLFNYLQLVLHSYSCKGDNKIGEHFRSLAEPRQFVFIIMIDVMDVDIPYINPLMGTGNYSATSYIIKLVHWPLVGGLLHFVHR